MQDRLATPLVISLLIQIMKSMSFVALKLLTDWKRRHLPFGVIYKFPYEIKIKNFSDI